MTGGLGFLPRNSVLAQYMLWPCIVFVHILQVGLCQTAILGIMQTMLHMHNVMHNVIVF